MWVTLFLECECICYQCFFFFGGCREKDFFCFQSTFLIILSHNWQMAKDLSIESEIVKLEKASVGCIYAQTFPINKGTVVTRFGPVLSKTRFSHGPDFSLSLIKRFLQSFTI